MLYADDAMLLLGDMSGSLGEAMSVIERYASFSGLVLNWSISSIMMLDLVPT